MDRTAPNICDLEDREFTQALATGAALGIPLIYLLSVAFMLAAGATSPALVALWPAIVGGPFFGALLVFSSPATHRRTAAVATVAPKAEANRRRAA